MGEPFRVKDCSLIVLSTGRHSRNMSEFLHNLRDVPADSLYHHFWGNRLQPQFDEPEYQNDFASWTRHGLHDPVLTERLAVVDPTDYDDLENLRRELVDIVEQRLAEDDYASWVQADYPFSFVRSQVVIFNTSAHIDHPRDLSEELMRMSVGSIFFHFIDARRRPIVGRDDFRSWLSQHWPAFSDLEGRLADMDPYFCTLAELRTRLAGVCRDYFASRA